MTPAERAVIDAARAYVAYYWGDDSPGSVAAAELYAAVRALPRPLSEQLAELRVGAVVEVADGQEATVLCVHEPSQTLFLQWCFGRPEGRFSATGTFYFRDIRRIISNPEADRG